jgi:hypothetical protein
LAVRFGKSNFTEKGISKMAISKELLNYVADGDFHLKLKDVEYSTPLREIVTVGCMLEQMEKAVS